MSIMQNNIYFDKKTFLELDHATADLIVKKFPSSPELQKEHKFIDMTSYDFQNVNNIVKLIDNFKQNYVPYSRKSLLIHQYRGGLRQLSELLPMSREKKHICLKIAIESGKLSDAKYLTRNVFDYYSHINTDITEEREIECIQRGILYRSTRDIIEEKRFKVFNHLIEVGKLNLTYDCFELFGISDYQSFTDYIIRKDIIFNNKHLSVLKEFYNAKDFDTLAGKYSYQFQKLGTYEYSKLPQKREDEVYVNTDDPFLFIRNVVNRTYLFDLMKIIDVLMIYDEASLVLYGLYISMKRSNVRCFEIFLERFNPQKIDQETLKYVAEILDLKRYYGVDTTEYIGLKPIKEEKEKEVKKKITKCRKRRLERRREVRQEYFHDLFHSYDYHEDSLRIKYN